jgi:glycosyltransferase involved in cell wall biosynthesis
MRIYVIDNNWIHIGSNSGFPLAEVLAEACLPKSVISLSSSRSEGRKDFFKYFSKITSVTLKLILAGKFGQSKFNSGSIWSTQEHSLLAFNALKKLKADHDSILVLPAADDQFCREIACAPDHLKKRIFLCFHQPPAWFRLNWRNFHDFESLGGIICLSEHQALYFRLSCQAPICVINHGVRHDYFSPPLDFDIRQGNRLVFVGQWLRDFDTLADAMELIWKCRSDIYLDCVVPRFARNSPAIRRLAVDQRVSWHADVSDVKLRNLYQAADLLFLPVIDAVANNAVVEALASGLPIVSTHVGGMLEYIPIGVGSLCPRGDASAHAGAAIQWLTNSSKRQSASELARQHAVDNFDWYKVGLRLSNFLHAPKSSLVESDNSIDEKRLGQ